MELNIVSEEFCPDKVPAVRATAPMPAHPRVFPADQRTRFHEAIVWNIDAAGNLLPGTGTNVAGPSYSHPQMGVPGPSLIR